MVYKLLWEEELNNPLSLGHKMKTSLRPLSYSYLVSGTVNKHPVLSEECVTITSSLQAVGDQSFNLG